MRKKVLYIKVFLLKNKKKERHSDECLFFIQDVEKLLYKCLWNKKTTCGKCPRAKDGVEWEDIVKKSKKLDF